MIELGMALKLKGLVEAEAAAEMTGMETAEVSAAFDKLVEEGKATETKRGHRLTPEGVKWVEGMLDKERKGVDHDAIEEVYAKFCDFNGDFKKLITDWQVKEIDGEQILNDHGDAEYDGAIIARLVDMDQTAQKVFSEATALVPRLGRYQTRFTEALSEIDAGDNGYISSPLKDSYHNVWFELHEELILLCGRNRADEAAAGRGA